MLTEEQKQIIRYSVEEFAEELTDIVANVEAAPETQKGHYATYMLVISKLAKDINEGAFVAAALIEAGANRYGVKWALKLLYNLEINV